MVSVLTWLLVGIVVYSLIAMALQARGSLPDSVNVSGPITTLHTGRGRALLNALARPKRLWRAYGNMGIGAGLVVMVLSFLLVAFAAIQSLQQPEPTPLRRPQNALVIPGVNEFLPLAAAGYIVLGLAIGLVVHEGGHGLFCRVADIDIESMGLVFFTILPIGAFVEPNEESRAAASRGDQTRMFVAGVTNNFLIAVIGFALLFGPITGALATVPGFHVGGTLPDGPADRAGIEAGDVIVGLDGTPIEDPDDLPALLANSTARTVTVERDDAEPATVERRLIVQRVSSGLDLPPNVTVTAVNDTQVWTRAGFDAAIQDREVGTLHWADGNTTLPLGAAVVVRDGPLLGEGLPADAAIVVTAAGGERILDGDDLEAWLSDRRGGESVTLTAYRNDSRETYNVTLGPDGGLGDVTLYGGTTTIQFNDFAIRGYPATQYLANMGGGGWLPDPLALPQQILFGLFLPFIGAAGVEGAFSFPGFVGVATNFFVAQGPLAVLGTGAVFLVANVLFWAAWINLVIGQFNLIPAFPLDGGHILRTGTEAIVARLPVGRRQLLTKAVTITVGLSMLGGLLLMFIGPQLVS